MKLSLCMIVKDEEENLPRCLKSVQGIVDEIVVVDTGSTDRTPAIAAELGAKVYHFPWSGSFSEARNFSLSCATGDWIIYLDADEELAEGEGKRIRELLSSPQADGYCVLVVNFVGEKEGMEAVINPSPRIFRNRPEYRFTGAIHEQIMASIYSQGGKVEFTDIKINHYGYLSAPVRGRKKVDRNLALLEKAVRESPEDAFNRFNLGVEYLRRRNCAAALEEFRTAFKYLPDLAVGYAPILVRNIALCLKELRKFEDALRVIADAKEVYPDYTDLVFLEGHIYLEQGDFYRAEGSFKECLTRGESATHHITQQGVGSYYAYFMLGQLYERTGDLLQAVKMYAQALKTHKRFYPALANLTRLLLLPGSPEKARMLVSSYIDLEDEETLLLLAQAFAAHKYFKEALSFAEKALELNPFSIKGYFIKGEILLNLKYYPKALEALAQIPPASFLYPNALLARAFALALEGKKEKAKEELVKLPDKFDLPRRVYLAFLERLINKDGYIEVLPEEEEEAAQILLDLLGRLLDLEAFEEFEEVLSLLEFLPAPERFLRLGKLYHSRGFGELAAEEIMAAVKEGKKDAEGLAILGEVAASKELHEEAVIFYQEALREGKGYLRWYTALVKELSFLGRYEEAAEVARRGLEVFPHAEPLKSLLPLLENISVKRGG
ncbi:Tetratricopeptide repeat-containing protein [Thermanaeromonas toyohensis ToBE]|uniref:Tetratricopeptide repeat-containing protein n=1 Tax=Thermanaeromonas toyohensis ToBE TaxID=698762 RepID=A0A1W1VL09_9FIRM|nr:TPR domain-containing glycosyltransferase [Thermanaeromonas toyohensis]SMB93900.1 Tetratricopeptide repeat-containing protein [Thermanaeromonas toyohensis ToBE]